MSRNAGFVIFLTLLLAVQPVFSVCYAQKLGPVDYAQCLPGAMTMGLKIVGARTDYSYYDILASGSVALFTELAVVNGLKYTVCESRPDGSGRNSFPSGHTAMAFTGAELVRSQYGWGWGTAAYAVATATGISRILDGRHWWWDVATGAAIGIGCARLGVRTCPKVSGYIKNLIGREAEVAVAPGYVAIRF